MVMKIYQHLPLQDPPKFTQNGIFGLKIYHLATLVRADGSQLALISQGVERKFFMSLNFLLRFTSRKKLLVG
jgi:hypothetical protein